MPHFSICTDAVFNGIDTAEAIRTCASLGLHTVEFWRWENKNMDCIIETARECNTEIAVFCAKMKSFVDPSARSESIEGICQSIEVAQKAGTKTLIGLSGNDTGQPRAEQYASMVAGLKEAAPYLEKAGITLVLEPLNILYNHAGYYLYTSKEGFDALKEVNSPNVKLLFDIYHQQLTEGNILNNIRDNIGLIGHFHTAGVPGRHELNNGELNYDFIFKEIDKLPYTGCIGLEYMPLVPPEAYLAALACLEGIKSS